MYYTKYCGNDQAFLRCFQKKFLSDTEYFCAAVKIMVFNNAFQDYGCALWLICLQSGFACHIAL